MHKGLFIFADTPLASNHSGAASRYHQNFTALAELCEEVDVLRLHTQDGYPSVLDFEKDSLEHQTAQQKARLWLDLEIDSSAPSRSYSQVFTECLFTPLKFIYPHLVENANKIREKVEVIAPDFLWVEHSEPAALVSSLNLNIPWIFSHIDILPRIRQVRYPIKNLRDRFFLTAYDRAEVQIDHAPTAVITASTTEADWLRQVRSNGQKGSVHYIPMAYLGDPVLPVGSSSPDVRIIHLGSLETTANRAGLTSYLEKVHHRVIGSLQETGLSCELWILGDSSRVKSPLRELLERSKAILAGYVPDLEAVLRPYDIAILPYEFDTGFRTKLPLFFKFYQVVVATRQGVAGTNLDGLENVCILTDTVDEFPKVISELVQDEEKRRELAQKAADFYQSNFRFDSVLPRYQQVLESL